MNNINDKETQAMSYAKEVGEWFGSFKEENGEIVVSNGETTFKYDTPFEMLEDWYFTLAVDDRDNNEQEIWKDIKDFIVENCFDGIEPEIPEIIDDEITNDYEIAYDKAMTYAKEVGEYYGEFKEENGKLSINDGTNVFEYNSPIELLEDWYFTLAVDDRDNNEQEEWKEIKDFIIENCFDGIEPEIPEIIDDEISLG